MLQQEIDSLVPASAYSRRRFVRTSLGSGFAAAVLPVTAQTIKTDTGGVTTGEVTIPVGDFKLPAFRAHPEGRVNGLPVVLVISEIFGVHEHIADVTIRFAKLGYLAIAPELFVRQGDAQSYGEVAKLIAEVVSKASDAQVMGDLDATVAWAKAQGADTSKLGITGFCWGGRTTLMYAAHNPGVKAAVAWYGPVARSYHPGDRTALDVAGQIKGAVLGLYGGADAGIPNDTVEKMRDALKAAGNTRSEFVIYPDTPHAFHADYRPSYRKEQAEDGWKRATAWFKAHGVG
ncbi:MAG: dienelactone hydrolase family protein [Piscinibacter sp.]|uniref:dienelactone hydrolase family protein n=1 Tax=Piscinibacter sp. TaxID=1903157 RepID=UPI00258A80F8|nr:dienelactone hydrolase family protein [Piscinibacter sp.]MCW5662608.1 dienelactone hydrolase family protein [Piscinibacter sp.]